MQYKMTRTMFNSILATRSEGERKINPYVYVIGVINEQFGLLGKVTHIIVD